MSQMPAWAAKAKQSARASAVKNGRELYIGHFMPAFGGSADLLDDAGGLIALHWALREFPAWAAEFMQAAAEAGQSAKLAAAGPDGRVWLHWAAAAGVGAADAWKMMQCAPVGLCADGNGSTALDLAQEAGQAELAGWLRGHFKAEGGGASGEPGLRTACQARAMEILGRPMSAKECAKLSQASAGWARRSSRSCSPRSGELGLARGRCLSRRPAASELALAAEMLMKMDAVFGQGKTGKRLSSM